MLRAGPRDEAGVILDDCDPADSWESWDDVTDARWSVTPESEARLSLVNVLSFELDRLRAMDSGVGDLMSEALGESRVEAEILGNPATADTFLTRRDAMLDTRASRT